MLHITRAHTTDHVRCDSWKGPLCEGPSHSAIPLTLDVFLTSQCRPTPQLSRQKENVQTSSYQNPHMFSSDLVAAEAVFLTHTEWAWRTTFNVLKPQRLIHNMMHRATTFPSNRRHWKEQLTTNMPKQCRLELNPAQENMSRGFVKLGLHNT
jgi:hypothetical protein